MNQRVVDVVVVTYRNEATIEACLTSVGRQLEVESVTVVDHGDDATAAMAAALAADVVRDPSNPGFGSGQNRGVALGRAPYVLLLNPDAVLRPGALAEGVHALCSDAGAAAAQGAILGADGALERSQGDLVGPVHLLGRAFGLRRLLRLAPVRAIAVRARATRDAVERGRLDAGPVRSLAATALLVRREAFEGVGGFDDRYFLYGEDLDLCKRFGRAGWRLIALPTVWAEHASGASSGSSWHRELAWWRGTLTYAYRWWSAPALCAAALASLVMAARLAYARPGAAVAVVREVVISGPMDGLRLRRRVLPEARRDP